ncbi:hypothetical protein HU200_067031 [Digitaria exilis]|uniref:VWFA domain-containing protein n=1 Tax=Digitaria exilis TaxID=1010633 RepID=A0A835DTB3_9POAL|nr:hypothetical protein HU200_067031 [Digitaria exilis]
MIDVQATAVELKVTTVPIVSALRHDKMEDDLKVLVRVEAPELQVVAKHPPIDLVAVVDVSGSMGYAPDKDEYPVNGVKSRMDYLKAALEFIIGELRDDDRLSIVQFNEGVKAKTPLMPISGDGRELVREVARSLIPDGGTAFKPALEEAVSILHGRGEDDSSRRVPFVIFLSDGVEDEDSETKTQWDQVISPESKHELREVLGKYPVHTFGFSNSHDPMALLAIARVSCGTYSYIDGQGLGKITDAFAVCLGGLTTVVAVNATITLSAAPGVTIVDIDSGGYSNIIKEHRTSGEVRIPVICEGEAKNFIIHLSVPRTEAARREQLLLNVDAAAGHGASTTITISEDSHHQLSIQRPATSGDDDDQRHDEAVLEQVMRFRLLELLLKGKELKSKGADWAQRLRNNWKELKNSTGLSTSSFDKGVEAMAAKLEGGSGQAFVFSYVSSHQMECATTIGSPENTITAHYKTPAAQKMEQKVVAHKPVEEPNDVITAAVSLQEVPPSRQTPSGATNGYIDTGAKILPPPQKVKVEAFTGSTKVVNDVVGNNKQECTPVLVRVTAGAPWRLPRTPVDVVAVLNISSGMKGSMQRMQEAMAAIISNLDKNDRLSLVLLEDVVSEEVLDLCPMDSKGHSTASEIIKRKTTSTRKFRECRENLSKDALEIVHRQDRQRCVMLLSGGGEDRLTIEDWITRSKEDKFQFHAFDLGAKHDAGRFQSIADKGAGTYHYMGADAKVVIKDAFTAFVVGLKSVVATSVKLTFKAEAGFSISSIETGGHYCWWDHESSGDHGIIDVADMHAGEQRSFIVYLSGGAGATQEKLDKPLIIDGEYLQAGSSSGEKTPLPCFLRGKDVAMNSEVAAEIVRVKLVKQVKEMVAKPEAHELMEEKWKVIRDSAEYKDAHGTELIKIVDKGMDEMMKLECHQAHTMVSWLSCHWWQRATAMPHHYYTCGAFRPPPATISTIIGANKSCLGIAGVVVVLVVLMLLRLLAGWNTTEITTPFNVTLDVVNHPQWPAMYGGISGTLHMVEKDTTSFFMGVSPTEMSQQIDQYLYMAILYAAALRARYNSTTDSITDKVKGHAQAYLQAMLQRINTNDALPAMHVNSVQNMSIAMSHHLHSKQKKVIDTLNTDKATLNTHVATLNTKIDTLITEKATLSTEIVTLKVDIEKMQNCCQLAERIKELEGAVEHNKVDEFTQEQDVSSRARRSLVV